MYQYKHNRLPKALSTMIDNSIQFDDNRTRFEGLKAKNNQKPGTLIFDLIKEWNICDDIYIKQRTYKTKSIKARIKKYYQKKSYTTCTTNSCRSCMATEPKKYENQILSN